ncbi:MAG: methyltransferase domain-containing protein [Allosphingosinicella sp.]|uniref:methyltransferase domain-containing protein n=1 Tax=Allosphingosinicella sp. TaxID=2823234 RepID=UPI00392394E8
MFRNLHNDRLDAVYRQLLTAGAASILDLGCGEGPLFARLAANPAFRRLIGVDADPRALLALRRRLADARLMDDDRLRLLQASFTDPSHDLSGFDAAILVETIEHIDPSMLSCLERALFEKHRPQTIIVTTPNVEFNDLLGVPRRRFRHPGHRFEWTRRKFQHWSRGVGRRSGYKASFHDVGAAHPRLGGPTQMAVFRKA